MKSVGFGVAVLLVGCGAPVSDREIGTAVYVGDEMVRDYRPRPMLVTKTTEVGRAKYPAFDVHCHWALDQDPHRLLAAMDERNVSHAVNLNGGDGETLDRMLERFVTVSDRFVIFCNIDLSRIDDPDFDDDTVAFLEDARAKGARGLKIFKDLGLRIRDGSKALVPIDDPRLDPIWAACGRLNMPVLIHTADPAAFFKPVDRFNERWMQLQRHPTWTFQADEYPSRETLFAQRNRVLTRHRNTTFIGAHMGGHAEDLATCARALVAHSNFHVDISGRVAELGRQPYTTSRFLLEHQDRVLFGTDRYPGRPEQPRYRIYFRFLETDDENFLYYDHPFPPAGDWRIHGVHLPDAVLKKIYQDNAGRIFGLNPSP